MPKPLRISENQPAFLSANDTFLLHLLQDSAQVFWRDGDHLGQLPLLERQLQSDRLPRLDSFCRRDPLPEELFQPLSA